MIDLLASNNILVAVLMAGAAVILFVPLTILAMIIIFAKARGTQKNR